MAGIFLLFFVNSLVVQLPVYSDRTVSMLSHVKMDDNEMPDFKIKCFGI